MYQYIHFWKDLDEIYSKNNFLEKFKSLGESNGSKTSHFSLKTRYFLNKNPQGRLRDQRIIFHTVRSVQWSNKTVREVLRCAMAPQFRQRHIDILKKSTFLNIFDCRHDPGPVSIFFLDARAQNTTFIYSHVWSKSSNKWAIGHKVKNRRVPKPILPLL